MRCPFCSADKDSLKVIDSRACDADTSIRRRRECLACGKRFTTYERVEQHVKLTVVKKDGRRTPWDKGKILTGLERACFKRPVSESEVHRIADETEEEIFAAYDREVPSTAIGELVSDKLRRVDQVAYVRFASVYRQFKTLDELVSEAQAVLDARRYETPGQGRLFIEPTPPRTATTDESAANGKPARRGKRNATDAAPAANGADPRTPSAEPSV
jgi:transcriptional repressor NrdR